MRKKKRRSPDTASATHTASFNRATRLQRELDNLYDQVTAAELQQRRARAQYLQCLYPLRTTREKATGKSAFFDNPTHTTPSEWSALVEELTQWTPPPTARAATGAHDTVAPVAATEHDDDAEESYARSIALDRCILGSFRPTSTSPPCVFEESIVDLHGILVDTFHSKGAVTDTMRHHVISKLLPRAGMSRLFSKLADEYMCSNAPFRAEMDRIFACSLIGNYRHTRHADRAGVQLRRFVYSVISPETCSYAGSEHNTTLWRLLFKQPLQHVFLLAMRDYLIYHVSDNPVLLEHMNARFDYRAFVETTLRGMGNIRRYLETALSPGGAITHESISNAKPCKVTAACVTTFQVELAAVVKVAYDGAKAKGFRKARADPCTRLRTVKGQYPPVTAWAVACGAQVYLKYPPRSDEKCSATRRLSRLHKRKATDAFGAGSDDDTPRGTGGASGGDDDEDGEGDADEAEVPGEGGGGRAAGGGGGGGGGGDEDGSLSTQATRAQSDAMEAKIHREMFGKARAVMRRQQQKLDEAARAERDDAEDDRARLAEEEGPTGLPDVDEYGFTVAYLDKLDTITKADPEKHAIATKYREARTRAVAAAGGLPRPAPLGTHSTPVIDRSIGPRTPGAIPLTRARITMEHDHILRLCLSSIHPATDPDRVFAAMCVCVSELGASAAGVESMKRLMRHGSEGTCTDKQWIMLLRAVRQRYPYTYNLLQAAATIWSSSPRLVTEELPHCILINQARAIAQRHKLASTRDTAAPSAVPQRACMFHYCSVCGRIYSIIQKRTRPGKTAHTHGLRDPAVDLATGELWCHNGKHDGARACGDQPICAVPMLGRIVSLRQRAYTLCCQPACGVLFALETFAPPYNRHGFACPTCWAKEKSRRHLIPSFVMQLTQGAVRPSRAPPEYDTLPTAVIPKPMECFICAKPLHLNKWIGIFGKSTFLCHKHETGPLVSDVLYMCSTAGVPTSIAEGSTFPDDEVRRQFAEHVRDSRATLFERKKRRNNATHKRYRAIGNARGDR